MTVKIDLLKYSVALPVFGKSTKISPPEVPPLLHYIQNQQRGRTAANNVIGNDVIDVVQEVLTTLGNIKLDSFFTLEKHLYWAFESNGGIVLRIVAVPLFGDFWGIE